MHKGPDQIPHFDVWLKRSLRIYRQVYPYNQTLNQALATGQVIFGQMSALWIATTFFNMQIRLPVMARGRNSQSEHNKLEAEA